MKIKIRSWLVTALGLLLVIGVLGGIKAAQVGAMVDAGRSAKPPPEAVTSATALAVEWEVTREAVATLVAVHGVMVGAEVPGTIRRIGFDSGASVKRGSVLVSLDASSEEAQLAGAVAEAELAVIDLGRVRALRNMGAISQADLDAAEARARQSAATAAQIRTIIAKKTIRAPFDGRVAIRQVEIGQVVSPGTPIASLQSVDPIYADFWLPQQALADTSVRQRVRLHTDVPSSDRAEGEVTTINPEVDVVTRNVRIRATLPNPGARFRPGMFAKVVVVSPEKRSALIIPVTAVLYAPYGDSVFVLEEERPGQKSWIARQRFVRLGERRGDFASVLEGLRAGERVVSTGAFKLQNGAEVVVNDALAPDAGLAPSPIDQ